MLLNVKQIDTEATKQQIKQALNISLLNASKEALLTADESTASDEASQVIVMPTKAKKTPSETSKKETPNSNFAAETETQPWTEESQPPGPLNLPKITL